MFNQLLLVSCICIIIALILYFFHWNRFVGFLVGRVIRLVYWSEEASSIWVEVGSIHFSLIAGRILLKDVSYHSSNQTLKIVKGQIQWRYWIRRPTTDSDINLSRGSEDQQTTHSTNCRIHISLQGFEWFLQNRTAAYEAIIARMEANDSSRPGSRSTDRRQSFKMSSRLFPSSPFYPASSIRNSLHVPYRVRQAAAWIERQLPSLDPKDLLPLGVEITKGSITCGNNSTPSLLVAEFQRSEGTFGIVPARSKFDLYKQLFSMKFVHAVVRYVDNENYVDSMSLLGQSIHERVTQYSNLGNPSSYLSYRSFDKLWSRLGLLALATKYFSDRRDLNTTRQKASFAPQKKSHVYTEEATPVGADFTKLEYAVERRILETPVLELSYYFDAVGVVPPLSSHSKPVGTDLVDVGNGDIPPEWGFDVTISGGVLWYGPWADRQRAELQRVLFPPLYHDGELTPSLKPGDTRRWTAMRIFIELRDNSVLHVPFRESSKDWQWDGKTDIPQGRRVRESATIAFNVGDRSSINYTMPMVVGPSGYQSILEVHLDTFAINSSLNNIRLVSAESCRIHCRMPTPLKWNTERNWNIVLTLQQPILYLIRDHINMFVDLGKDWTTGPPSDYQTFIPMIYTFEFKMRHYALKLYANDHNIIDSALGPNQNSLLTIRGPNFEARADIPSNKYWPESITIPFAIDMSDISINLSLPRWNTNALHVPEEGTSLANIHTLCMKGSYMYFTEIRENFIEQLKLKLDLHDVAFKNLGWSIRCLMVLRENYLGSFTHFSTLREYLDRRARNQPPGDPMLLKYRPGKNNMLQVEIQVIAKNSIIIMPAGLPGYSSTYIEESEDVGIGHCLVVILPDLQLQFRMHDHYMEMSLNVGAISGSLINDYPERVTYRKSVLLGMKDIFHVDGLDITANRLFGPQPRTSTYVCIWEVALGGVKVILSASQGQLLAAAGNAFRLNFADFANAPASKYLPHVDPDVTFLKLSIKSFDITWQAGRAALVFALPKGVKLDSNDLGGQYYRKVVSLKIAEIYVKILLSLSLNAGRWLEAMGFSADVYLDIYSAPQGFRDLTKAQMAYIEEQDLLTGRAHWMLAPLGHLDIAGLPTTNTHRNGIYLPHPLLPNWQDTSKLSMQPTRNIFGNKSWASTTQLSESDTEEMVSEADRDARLAKTRSSTPAPRFIYDDDRNMSSGDESDDEDLTDASSVSDWSDFDESEDNNSGNTALRHYSYVSRHYVAPSLMAPDLWDGCPFVLVRDRVPLETPSGYSTDQPDGVDRLFENSSALSGSNDKRDTTTIRYRGKKPVNINVTPLIILALAHFEEDLRVDPLSPELCIDAMMATHVGNISSSRTSYTLFDVAVPSVKFRALQRIPMADGHPTMFEDPLRAKSFSELDVMAILQVKLQGLSTSGVLSKDKPILKMEFDQTSINLSMSVDKKTVKPTSPGDFVFSCTINGFESSVERDSRILEVHLGESTLRIGHLGPEYIVATGIALAQSTNKLASLAYRWRHHSSSLKQSIVADIIRCSREEPAVDLLSTIQPSYLVQSGIPQILRTDATFRFLYHLRNCLWHLEAYERDMFHSLQNPNQQADLKDLVSALESRLIALDPDSYSIARRSFLETFFSLLEIRHSHSASLANTPAPKSISIQLAKTVFIVLDPSDALPSKLIITDVNIDTRILENDVTQPPVSHPPSMSRTSLQEKSISKASASISLGNVTLSIFPHLMGFIQKVLRVRRYYYSAPSATQGLTPAHPQGAPNAFQQFFSSDIVFSLQYLSIQAAAENLVFEFGLSGIQGSSSILLLRQGYAGQSMNHSVFLDTIFLRARSPSDMAKESDQGILASLEMTKSKINAVSRNEPSSKSKHLVVIVVNDLQSLVPRSALRLYRFVQEWRADFLPGIEATAKDLLSEFQRAKPNPPHSQLTPSRHPSIQVQGQLLHMGISLQVMHGTWLSWQADNMVFYATSSNGPTREAAFGFQLASMAVIIASKLNTHDDEPSTRMKLVLPRLSATGYHDESGIHTIALVDFIELKVKPSHWDALLVVQQKFGQDFHDLVTLIQETSHRQSAYKASEFSEDKPRPVQYSGFMKIRGFRVGLEGLTSTLYLECLDVDGGINNSSGLTWNVELSDLAFSLAPRAVGRPNIPGLNRSHRSAFVIIDFQVNTSNQLPSATTSTIIKISVTKIHAVMQPSSIGEIGDFIDYLQAEMLDRKEQRALELAAFKEKTQTILKTFEVGIRDTQLHRKSWLENYIISIVTHNIGVAFPLARDQELQLPQTRSNDTTAVPAFLWSIGSIEFETHQGQTGQVVMKNFSFQFVSRFRQSTPNDFHGENHVTRNRLIYPEMEAQLRSTKTTALRHIQIGANVSGFILDVDSKIPSYVFSLVDVYNQGKARVERLANSLPRTPSVQEAGSHAQEEIQIRKRVNALPTSNLFAALTFLSGKVRVYSGAASDMYRARALLHKHQEPSDELVMEMGAEVFNLPVVSVWAEYRATPSLQSQKMGIASEAESSILIFKSTVHSSQNTLRPTLLSFFTELVSHIEARLRRVSLQSSSPGWTVGADVAAGIQEQQALDSINGIRVSFSLRIDQSKLELTCQPDVNVIAGLHWDNGGFVFNIFPGSRKVTFTGSVGGLTLGLKHGFLSEDCVKLNARNLAFSVSFSKDHMKQGTSIGSVSAILDTEFLGVVRFSRLQDILCFKAVWLDRIPVLNSQSAYPIKSPLQSPSSTSSLPQPKTQFATVILVRVRQITLDVDLGQSISAMTLDIKDAVMRTKLTEALSELSISVADLAITAKGNISGYAHVPSCLFQTIRSNEAGTRADGKRRMLELSMKSGRLVISLESDHQKLLHYRAEPLEVNIYDDWSLRTPQADTDAKPLQLSFTIVSPEIVVVATVGTIPKLLAYVNKFKDNLDTQRIGASRESKAFRVTRTPKPDNPLSAVAEAMLYSARNRFKEFEDEASPYIIMQHMSLQLDFLRLVVFPRTMDDLEIAHFVGRDVVARLDRLLESDSSSGKRDLLFSFSSMTISKFTGLGHPQTSELSDEREWLTSLLNDALEAIIVGLPSMTMHMTSEEKSEDVTTTLLYDFYSQFKRSGGDGESKDIYITLNVSLYSWLTLLRKNLTREMDQVKAATDWRAVLNNTSSLTELPRKKAPEPLNLSSSSPRSSTMPSPAIRPFSPFSPTTALKSSMDGQLGFLPPSSSVTFPLHDSFSSSLQSPSPTHRSPSLGHQSIASTEMTGAKSHRRLTVTYQPRSRHIERLTMRQLGEATPDVMHPFFMKRAGFNLEDSLPQYVHEYATTPLEEIMEVLLKIYSRQLLSK